MLGVFAFLTCHVFAHSPGARIPASIEGAMRDAGTNPARVVRFRIFEADLDSKLRRRGAGFDCRNTPSDPRGTPRTAEQVVAPELQDALWSADTFVD
jgi:hypothetical protein